MSPKNINSSVTTRKVTTSVTPNVERGTNTLTKRNPVVKGSGIFIYQTMSILIIKCCKYKTLTRISQQ